jgi:large subunit ribosomal protein L21
MYAIIETGGKQYRVEKGDEIDVELIDPQSDGKVQFDRVLFLNTGKESKIGAPHIGGCLVLGEFIQEVKGPKVIAFKYKRRKGIRSTKGHRQRYSRVKIVEITGA